MEIATQDIAAIVQVSGQIWVITKDGQWLPAEQVTSSLEGFNIETLTQDELNLEAEQPVALVGGQWLTIPTNVINTLPSSLTDSSQNNNQPDNANHSPEQQQGFNFFYQWLQRDGNEKIAESGFDTEADSLFNSLNETPETGFQNGNVDPAQLPDLTVNIADGGDEWINQFEIPAVTLFGDAKYTQDGQSLTITLTDSKGTQLSFETTALNQQ